MNRRHLILPLLALLALPLFAGCKQKEGKPCQTTSDCSGDLVCCFDGAGAASALGVCLTNEACYPIDAAVGQDVAVGQDAEVGQDAQMSLDASPTQDASP